MRKCSSFFILSNLLCLALEPIPAWAYLDPGTGSMLLSVIVGVVSSVYFFVRRLPALIRAIFFKFSGNKDDLKKNAIVFYAESAAYWSTFQPILEALIRKGFSATYLTSDENDPIFKSELKNHIHAKFIGRGQTAYTALGFLEAEVFALTTPGIDVLQIRRSPGVKNYVHIVHAVGDIHTYKLFSYDYYDTVLCSGPAQIKSLRTLETLRRTKPKELKLLGCPYMDKLVMRSAEFNSPEENTLLVAPTWGANGLLTRTGSLIPKILAQAGYHVILRPHPQSFVSDAVLMDRLTEELKDTPNIEWDRNPDGFKSLSRAKLMISDVSGVIFDFAFTFLRPVIAVGNGPLKAGFEAWTIPHPAWEMEALHSLGKRILPGQEHEILGTVKELLNQHQDMSEIIRKVRSENVVNFGCASEPIAEELIALSKRGH